MSIQRNVFTGIYISKSANPITATTDGFECTYTSCVSGRRIASSRGIKMEQKVTSELFQKRQQEIIKFELYLFMFKLLGEKLIV